MNYLYGISILVSLGLSVTVSKILASRLRTSPRARLYVSLLLGVETEEEDNYTTVVITLWVAVVILNLLLVAVEPILQIGLAAYMVDVVISRLIRVRKQLNNIEKLMEFTKHRCEVHPEIVKAICLEEDGEIHLVCPLCDPEVAEDFGISVGDCLDKKDNDGVG